MEMEMEMVNNFLQSRIHYVYLSVGYLMILQSCLTVEGDIKCSVNHHGLRLYHYRYPLPPTHYPTTPYPIPPTPTPTPNYWQTSM